MFNRREDWAPRDADQLERGPVLVRKALQYSLNIPAIRALQRVGNSQVDKTAEALGLRFTGGREAYPAGGAGRRARHRRGPAGRPHLGLRRAGQRRRPRPAADDPRDRGPDGKVVWQAPEPEGTAAVSPQAAFLVTRHPRRQHGQEAEPDLGREARAVQRAKGGTRRPAAVKTGTSNDARDLATYGFLAPPTDDHPGLAVGVWMGNSDHSNPRSRKPAISLTAAAPLWHAFVRDYTKDWPVDRLQAAQGRRQGHDRRVVRRQARAVDAGQDDGLVHRRHAAGRQEGDRSRRPPLQPVVRRLPGRPRQGRARAGELGLATSPTGCAAPAADPARTGQYDSRTAYFWKQSSWGGPIAGSCYRRQAPTRRTTAAARVASTAASTRKPPKPRPSYRRRPRRLTPAP